MINVTAYDTSACASFKISKIQEELQKARILNALVSEEHHSYRQDMAFNYYLVTGGTTESDNVKYFTHPMLFKTTDKDEHRQYIYKLAIDVRNYGSWNKQQENFIVRNKPGYDFETDRLVLNHIWIKEDVRVLRDISHIPAIVYSAIISECIGKRFALNPKEMLIVSIWATYFYYCLFTDDKEFSENEFSRLLYYISVVTKFPVDDVRNIVEIKERKTLAKLDDLCAVIKESTGNVALSELNLGILFAVTANVWYGVNSKEVLTAGLEHPPTWLAIVYAALTENTYKRSNLAKLTERRFKNTDEFTKQYKTLTVNKPPY